MVLVAASDVLSFPPDRPPSDELRALRKEARRQGGAEPLQKASGHKALRKALARRAAARAASNGPTLDASP